MVMHTVTLLAALSTAAVLQAQAADEPAMPPPEYPLALNLPTADSMKNWELGLGFTHRFVAPVKGNGKDAYGLDGMAYAALGLNLSIKPIPGLNAQLYRTADNKTVTVALQQRLLDRPHLRLGVRAEYFKEGIDERETSLGSIGIKGGVYQLPADIYFTNSFAVSIVPTYLTRTTSRDKGLFTAGAGARFSFLEYWSVMAEYYPRPSRLDSTFHSAFAAGVSYKSYKHRFTLLGTNAPGTTAHQVLSGDYAGGPREAKQWALGFNLTREY